MKKLNYYFIILLFSGISTAVNSQTWTQIGASINGEAEGDYSGQSISLNSDGLIAAIGAWGNDGNGPDAGHVRIYRNNSETWAQIGEDIDGEAADDLFGFTVSLNFSGSIVAIGAYKNDGNGLDAGHVRIYQNNSGTWTQMGEDIDGEGIGDYSGCSVSISSDGMILAIGARNNDGNGSDAGHVRIYQNNSGIWTQVGDDIDGEAEGDHSGWSVCLSSDGSVVAIGAPSNDKNGIASGHVKVYKNNSGTWSQIGVAIDGEAEGDYFGRSVSLSSDGMVLAVGAIYNDGNGPDSGHTRIYQNNSGTWVQIGGDIDGEAESDYSGYSVSLSSDGSVVGFGAHGNDKNGIDAGHVRIYQNNSGVWTQIGEDIEGEAEGDWCSSVSLSSDGSVVAICSAGNDENGDNAGHTRIFKLLTTNVGAISLNDHLIYPNPTNGIIKLDFAESNIKKITISDINGKTIIEKTTIQQNGIINLSQFVSGIYIISIQTDKEIFITKIVKE